MSELLDVLDKQGIPTGTNAARAEVHGKGLWHGTVHIYVYRAVDKEIQILVHLRATNKDLYPNTWDPVLGGHIRSGQTPIQTVIDELNDEVGLSVSPNDLVVGPIVKTDKGLDKEFNHLFAYHFPPNAEMRFRDNEVQKVKWMSLDEVLEAIRTFPSEWRPTADEFLTAHSAMTSLLRI